MMGFSSGIRPSPGLVVALVALFVAMAGTSVAQNGAMRPVTKSQVKQIAKQQIQKAEPNLSVASAASAGNADRLDELDSTQFLRSEGCQPGVVAGFARFDPGQMAAGPGYSTAGISASRNCSGASVEGHRISAGDYRIRFNGLGAANVICGQVSDGDSAQGITSFGASLIAPGHWRIRQGDLVNNTVADNKFSCLVG